MCSTGIWVLLTVNKSETIFYVNASQVIDVYLVSNSDIKTDLNPIKIPTVRFVIINWILILLGL